MKAGFLELMEGEMKEVKQINKHLYELEEEIEKYMSNRDKNPYKNYKERIKYTLSSLFLAFLINKEWFLLFPVVRILIQ